MNFCKKKYKKIIIERTPACFPTILLVKNIVRIQSIHKTA